uniref:Uncharacterized protein n=1 Tax=Nelumbo nucifera TaxID=4432 RepID=A0A822YZ36_NELNU|nr:TPA_asm: hypothetical protein HUJ06_005138 [Nelumbo nucifera]
MKGLQLESESQTMKVDSCHLEYQPPNRFSGILK